MRRTVLLLLALWLSVSPLHAGDGRLTILHFNDFHGQLVPYPERGDGPGSGGIARLAAAVAAVRAEVPARPVLLLFAGDLLQGTMLSTLFHGLPDVELFNTLVVGRLTGERLLAVLARSAAMNPGDNPGGFLQVAGIRFGIRDGRVQEPTLADGTPLDPQADYRVVTSDFLAAGGDGYAVLKRMRDPVDTGHRLSDLLVQAFGDARLLEAATDGRIRRIPTLHP